MTTRWHDAVDNVLAAADAARRANARENVVFMRRELPRLAKYAPDLVGDVREALAIEQQAARGGNR